MMTTGGNDPLAPYIGPIAFEPTHRKFFCGRNKETDILISLVTAHRVSLFFAQSGAGKSSLLHAGLVPKVTRKKRIGWGDRVRYSQMMTVLPILTVGKGMPPRLSRPVDNVFVFSALLGLPGETPPNDLATMSLPEGIAYWPGVDQMAEPTAGASNDPPIAVETPETTLLIFDQFEELFTGHPDRWPEREGFFQQVNQVLEQRPDLHVLFTIREDYLAQLTPYAPLLPEQLRHRFRLERLQREAAIEAVKTPAHRATPSREFAPHVAETLVDNLRRIQIKQNTTETESTTALGEYIEPVHLQIVCRQLWENLPETQTTIRAEDVTEFGDVDQALTGFYEDSLQKVLVEIEMSERQLRAWFAPPLITPARTKGLVYRGDTETGGLSNPAVDSLNNSYIIRADIRGGDTWYELAHDRLVEPILTANQKWQATYYNPLATATEVWLAAGRSPDLLLEGAPLREAERYAEQNPLDVTNDENTFLEKSLRREAQLVQEKRLADRRRWITIVVGVVVIIFLLALTAWAFQQQTEAKKQAQIARDNAATATFALGNAERNAATATFALGDAERNAATATFALGDAERNAATATFALGYAEQQAATAVAAQEEAAKEAVTAEAARIEAEDALKDAATAETNAKNQAEIAQQNAEEAAQQKATAEAAGTAVAEQLMEGAKLIFELFWRLPTREEQLNLLKVKDEKQVEMIKILYVHMADVNQGDYTGSFLEAMVEGLTDLPKTTDKAMVLKDELEQWLQARQQTRQEQYDVALEEYDNLIDLNNRNPAILYERAVVKAKLRTYEAALEDLEQVMTLVNNIPSFAESELVAEKSQFATTNQVIQSIGQLIYQVEPALGKLFDSKKANYPSLAEVASSLVEFNLPGEIEVKDAKMILVPAGPFEMGSDPNVALAECQKLVSNPEGCQLDWFDDEAPIHTVGLDDFYIDKYEVTNAQFATFLDERGNQTEGDKTWLNVKESSKAHIHQNGDVFRRDDEYANHPVIEVTWYGARAYCEWREARLPTEAEWEKAARGTDKRMYPWGNEFDGNQVNFCDSNCELTQTNKNYDDGYDKTAPVGSYPQGVSPYGVYDMAGNVSEWVQSKENNYPYQVDDGRENLDGTDERVLRGGAWANDGNYTRTTARSYENPAIHDIDIGFRCARLP